MVRNRRDESTSAKMTIIHRIVRKIRGKIGIEKLVFGRRRAVRE